jgi:hypothetical protein
MLKDVVSRVKVLINDFISLQVGCDLDSHTSQLKFLF